MKEIISVTNVVEHGFCPKFTYYGLVLGLRQYEEKRGTVQAGKYLHSKHEKRNINFLPSGMEGKKLVALTYYSKTHNFIGKIDEAIEKDDEIVLIERKYTDTVIIGPTINIQIGLLSILLEENVKKPVNRAILIFSKTGRKIVNFNVSEEVKQYSLKKLDEVKNILSNGINPDSWFDGRCMNCCFNRVCPIGSLNRD